MQFEGITTAISTYWAPDRKISIYVFGDDFQGGSVEAVCPPQKSRSNSSTSAGGSLHGAAGGAAEAPVR